MKVTKRLNKMTEQQAEQFTINLVSKLLDQLTNVMNVNPTEAKYTAMAYMSTAYSLLHDVEREILRTLLKNMLNNIDTENKDDVLHSVDKGTSRKI